MMTDAELIRKSLDGELAAFNTIVWRWQPAIYRFALRFLGDSEDARDVTQKIFIKVYKSLRSLHDPERFSAWIYRIAVNMCKDERKRHRKHEFLPIENIDKNASRAHAPSAPDRNSPAERMHREDLQRLLNDALARLPEAQRTVIIMKEFQELKFREIAEILGISENTVKSRMYYGLDALRKIFASWNIDKEVIHYEL